MKKEKFGFAQRVTDSIRRLTNMNNQCWSCGRMYDSSLCESCGYVKVVTTYGPVYVPIEECINGVLTVHD